MQNTQIGLAVRASGFESRKFFEFPSYLNSFSQKLNYIVNMEQIFVGEILPSVKTVTKLPTKLI